jgi:hypothetical protein
MGRIGAKRGNLIALSRLGEESSTYAQNFRKVKPELAPQGLMHAFDDGE